MISLIGWILWGIVGVNAVVFLITSILPGGRDAGGRKVFRLQALIWLVGVILTAVLPISMFHLVWIYAVGAIAPYYIMGWRIDKGMAEMVRRHLEQESGGEVWSWSQMRRLYRVHEVVSPQEFAKNIDSPEFVGWWVAGESGIGEVKVSRRADNKKGTLLFKDKPRLYFGWTPDA